MLDNHSETKLNGQIEIDSLLNQLNEQLIGYQIRACDRTQVIAIVKDFYLAERIGDRQINLSIDLLNSNDESVLRLLQPQQIKSIDLTSKTIVVDLTAEELEQLPLDHHIFARSSNNESKLPVDLGEKERINHAINQQQIAKIPLLEERITVNRNKRKIGEVSVRKKIETKIVQIPLRREVLIIEQVGEETKKLAEVDLDRGDNARINSNTLSEGDYEYVIVGEYSSIELARQILDKISSVANNLTSKPRIKLEILVDNPVQQKVYQNLLKDRLC
jgi:stress response protein YsnF